MVQIALKKVYALMVQVDVAEALEVDKHVYLSSKRHNLLRFRSYEQLIND